MKKSRNPLTAPDVAKGANDLFAVKVKVEGDVVPSLLPQMGEEVGQERSVAEGQHRLGHLAGQVTEARPAAGAEDHGLHRSERIQFTAATKSMQV